MTVTQPYGTWPSPITAESLVEDVVRLADVLVDGDDLYWVERRPSEQGRQVIVRRSGDGEIGDVLPRPFSARTLVHEYGGLSYAVRGGVVWFASFDDQRVWRIEGGADPQPITADDGTRWADFDVSPDGATLLAVRERHLEGGVVNDVVAVPSGGGTPEVVAEGHDFFSAPRWSPDGSRRCWLSWDHPRMPWDGTDLWVDGDHVAGGPEESISQPRWLPDGRLAWASDRSGWWNLYVDGRAVADREAEHSGPDWVFGQSSYVPTPAGGFVAAVTSAGKQSLVVVGAGGDVAEVATGFTAFSSVRLRADNTIGCIAGSPTSEPAVVIIDPTTSHSHAVRASSSTSLDASFVSEPEPIEFPSPGGRTAHALYYAPRHPDRTGPDDERPPLVVMTHGGPTGSTSATLNRAVQLWTSRGMAVVDVNYGGSTGYGRAYRNELRGRWGIVDVDDAVAAAEFLAGRGDVDGRRMVIRGGSAGGYTTLAALTFRPGTFAAGTSLYGVGDLEALARDTHKFESRYLDGLVGAYPEERDVYVERSPIHHTDRLSCPLLLLQGSEDKVVPPNQAEDMAAALEEKGIPYVHVVFEGEQHGFRKAETIVRAAELELWFYGRVLGFEPADAIEPAVMHNAESLS